MHWYHFLYVSENLPNNIKSIRWMVEHRIHLKPLYLIVISEIPDGQLEIIPASTLKLPFFKKQTLNIIGVAKGRYHARTLVETIIKEVFEKTGDCDAKSYFEPYFKEEKGE